VNSAGAPGADLWRNTCCAASRFAVIAAALCTRAGSPPAANTFAPLCASAAVRATPHRSQLTLLRRKSLHDSRPSSATSSSGLPHARPTPTASASCSTAQLQEQRRKLSQIERRAKRARAQHDCLLDEGDDVLATAALREVIRIETEREQLALSLDQAERRLTEWHTPDVDAALDYYVELRDAIAGWVQRAKSIRDLNAVLRTVLERIWLHTLDDDKLGQVLIAQFVLRRDEQAGRPPDISLATRVEHWRRLLDDGQPIVPSEGDPGTTRLDTDAGVAIPPVSVRLSAQEHGG
jgi:hypothetical protein